MWVIQRLNVCHWVCCLERPKTSLINSVVWTRTENAIEAQPNQPLIVVISRCKRDISSQIVGHYLIDDYKRWDRLNGNHAWVYLDLYFLFTKWDRVWGAVKQNLSIRTEVGKTTYQYVLR
jgi:hypothetical protein